MSEVLTVEKWFYTVLAADATLAPLVPGGFHADLAPEGVSYPLVIWTLIDSGDAMGVNGLRIQTTVRYLVKVVGQTASFVALETAANRIDTLLHRASGSVTGGFVFSCVRLEPVRYTEHSDGQTFRHLGGLYELQAQ